MGSKTSLSTKDVLSQLPLINSQSFFPPQIGQNFLFLLLDKTLVMETAHISSLPSQNCGSEVLPNANCILSEEGGKNQNKPNWTAKQKLSPNFEQLLNPFPLWFHCRTKIISQSRSLSTFLTSCHWNHQEDLMGSTANSIRPQCTHTHTKKNQTQSNTIFIHQQRKNNKPHRVVGISLRFVAELKLFLRKGYLRDAGRAVLALQLMLMKIQRKRAALQPARVTTTILHFLAPCTPNASRRRPAFLHFGPLRSLSFSSSEEVSRR